MSEKSMSDYTDEELDEGIILLDEGCSFGRLYCDSQYFANLKALRKFYQEKERRMNDKFSK